EMKKRTKLTLGAIIVAALLLISAVGVAVGVLVQEYYAKVAQMERDGALERWELDDKIKFIDAMKECNFELDEDLYALVKDETRSGEEREAAADRIVNSTYGELLQQELFYYETNDEDSLGIAPDVYTVFQERYFAEHPDWEDDYESYQAYFDALGHYLRDEIGMLKDYSDSVPEEPVVDEAYAVKALKGRMTVMMWDAETVEALVPQVEWDDNYRMWTVSGEVSDASMEKATDLRRDMNPVLSGNNIEKTETGYRYTILVDEKGRTWDRDLDKEAFRKEYLNQVIPVEKISVKKAMELAETAVKEKYQPDEEGWKEVFADAADFGIGGENAGLKLVYFHKHYYRFFYEDYLYGAVVNMADGRVEALADYRDEAQAPEWQLLNYAARTEQKEGWYSCWKPESKQGLIDKIRACGLLPEHAYWQLAEPAEADTDAFAAELFGAKGRLSLVNVKVMLHSLKGPEKDWDPETKLLADRLIRRYGISSEDLREQQEAGEDIDAAKAEKIIRAAVCEAWNMPADALDNWAVVPRLVQDAITVEMTEDGPIQNSMVYYRVFLTRPDEEVGLDTFGGRDNFNYRVSTDGNILTTEDCSGWYSPKEDMERWKK
ncbi:MAG: hypothetical protein J6Y48_02470, partial [Clostridia bacterium]|nr:hypothetical protein [Clostridia bacterium]